MSSIPKRYWWVGGIWLVLFGLYSLTAWQQLSWPVFSSPDETANFAFAQQDRHTSNTLIPTTAPGAPRGIINTGKALVPGSFVFFPHLTGFVGKVSGTFGMLMLGPALAASAVLAWWFFVRRLFDSSVVAWTSSAVLATFPTFAFYAGRGLWQNGVFVSLLILSIAATAWAWRVRHWGVSAGTGLLWGVLLAIRPSEISWLLPGLVAGALLGWRHIPWKHIAVAAACAVVPIACLFIFQQRTYGSATSIGYRPAGALDPSPIVQNLNTFQQVKNVFFPFGTNPKTAWENFRTYGVTPVAYVVLPTLVGVFWLAWRAPASARRFLLTAIVAGFFLALLYGNYRFVEYPAVREAVLDGSYLRYWLPLVPLVALGVGGLVQALGQHRFGRRLGWVLAGGIVAVNVSLFLFDNTVGLVRTLPRLREAQAESRWIASVTPSHAVIVAGSRDKLVFPYRHAIGFNGTVPSALTLGDAPARFPTYILLSNASQIDLLPAAFPDLVASERVVGPNGLTIVRLAPR